jgi:hypothetical protein
MLGVRRNDWAPKCPGTWSRYSLRACFTSGRFPADNAANIQLCKEHCAETQLHTFIASANT